MWDFSTEPAFQEKLDWMADFVREEIHPLETLDLDAAELSAITAPLKQRVRDVGLWAAHLPPELGGGGFGQVKYALMCEILGSSPVLAPAIFGNQAPDSGNAEIIALYGTPQQKDRYLKPLLDGKIRSCFSMTEPGAGADPTRIETRAVRDGGHWVIDGHKWFSSNARIAEFLIVMCVTDPEVPALRGTSMIIVPTNTPGVRIHRDVAVMGDPGEAGDHAEILYESCRVPIENLLGGEGEAFVIAQKRLGPGRIHHCMRNIGLARRAFDMLCERALSRHTHGGPLAEKQTVQNWIADSFAEVQAARLMTLHAAWVIDQKGASAARVEIAAIKYFGNRILHDVVDRALQIHGALGFSKDMPLHRMYTAARAMRIVDGPDEIHRVTVARRVLRDYAPHEGLWPREHVPTLLSYFPVRT